MTVILPILSFESLNCFYINLNIYIYILILIFRGEKVNRVTFKERNDGAFQSSKLSTKINNIESFIHNNCSISSKYYDGATLRDRFQFFLTLGAVIRSKSVFKIDFSDLIDFTYHQENEPDPYYALIMRIGFWKTVKGDNPIHARGLRHHIRL